MQSGDIGKIENARLRPYPSQLRKIGQALGLPPDEVDALMENVDGEPAASEVAR
jgi:hypothetical protein